MHLALRIYDRLILFLGELPGYLIGLMAVGISAEVFSRDLGFGSIRWMLEAVEYGILIIAMSGAAYVLRIGRHVTIDLVTNALPGMWRRRAEIAAFWFALIISAVLAYYGYRAAADSYESGAVLFLTVTVSEWIPLAVVPLGLTLVATECARRIWLLSIGAEPEARDGTDGI